MQRVRPVLRTHYSHFLSLLLRSFGLMMAPEAEALKASMGRLEVTSMQEKAGFLVLWAVQPLCPSVVEQEL